MVPPKTTITYRIAEYIYFNGAMTTAQIAAAHPDISQNTVRSSVGRLCFGGQLQKDGEKFTLTAEMRRHFAHEHTDKEQREVAQRREHSVFATTLHPSRIPSIYGARLGSNDYRAWPSKR